MYGDGSAEVRCSKSHKNGLARMLAQCLSDREAEVPARGSLDDDVAPMPTLSNFKIRLRGS
jgi:hypothetical protein